MGDGDLVPVAAGDDVCITLSDTPVTDGKCRKAEMVMMANGGPFRKIKRIAKSPDAGKGKRQRHEPEHSTSRPSTAS